MIYEFFDFYYDDEWAKTLIFAKKFIWKGGIRLTAKKSIELYSKNHIVARKSIEIQNYNFFRQKSFKNA